MEIRNKNYEKTKFLRLGREIHLNIFYFINWNLFFEIKEKTDNTEFSIEEKERFLLKFRFFKYDKRENKSVWCKNLYTVK